MKSDTKIAALAGVLTALAIVCSMGAYALTNYATPFQIQPVNATNNTQTVAIGSGCTLGSDAGSTVNLSSGTVTLPTMTAGAFVGSSGTGTCTLTGATVGQRVIALWDMTSGTSAAGSTAAQGYFATSITTSGSITQTSTANLSTKGYGVILMNTGP